MLRTYLVVVYRLGMVCLVAIAIGVQIADLAGEDTFKPANFFSFFTIQSNLFACAVFVVGSLFLLRRRETGAAWDYVRGAAVVYMTVTMITFALLLSDLQEELQLAIPWVDNILHRVMPLVVLADWFLVPPRTRFTLRRALWWLAYPLLYLAYSLLRGPLVDWYPYPFVDPREHGYDHVAVQSLFIFLGTLLLIAIFVAIANLIRSRPSRVSAL